MVTQQLVGIIQPGQLITISTSGLYPAASVENFEETTKPKQPKNRLLNGCWSSAKARTKDKSNILGGNGEFIASPDLTQLDIPIANTTKAHLAYYDCLLVKQGEPVCFDGDEPLPVFDMDIGKHYVEEYLLQPSLGNGAYLEVHDRPHYHMPLNHHCRGHLILAKRVGNQYRLSAFSIPNGYAVYMKPWVIHSDAFLVGQYRVVYSITKHFSTVLLKDNQHHILKVSICEPD